jgi:CDP-6-deoxy-D-xylo-4-hexulose-3-dehydrase
MQAAVGCAQLKKFPGFVEKRKANWAFLKEALADTADRIILPEAEPHSDPSWFGFCMTLAEGIDRTKVLRYVEGCGVQTRLLFAGNLTRQPCFDAVRGDDRAYRVVGKLTNTDIITERTFWIGVYPGMTKDRLEYMAKTIREAVRMQ